MKAAAMFKQVKPACVMLCAWTLLAGIIYPALVTGLAQLVFPHQASGSLITDNGGRLVGSELVGQPFADASYFWGRPSATLPFPYNAAASGGSNLGPTNPALAEAFAARLKRLKTVDPENTLPVPVDLLTASASGLDPHISPAAAGYQAARIAEHRRLPLNTVQQLIALHSEERQWGVLGEPRVNVLRLNRALDELR